MAEDEIKYEERSFPHDERLDNPFYRRWDRKLRIWVPLEETGGREDRFGQEGMSA